MRQLCHALCVVLLLVSCKDKVICPAFQSTYILDDSVRNTYFLYAWYLSEDERAKLKSPQPKISPLDSLGEMVASTDQSTGIDYFAYTADYKVLPNVPKQTKYGIVKQASLIPNFLKNLQLKTSPKVNVLTPPEVTKGKKNVPISLDSSALAPLDSTAAIAAQDSLNVGHSDPLAITKAQSDEEKKKAWVQFKYGFDPAERMQPDQEYYFRRYGWLLQNAAPKKESADDSRSQSHELSSDSTPQKRGLKWLFRKKDKTKKNKKEQQKTTENETPSDEPFGNNKEAIKPKEGSEEGGNE